MSIRIIWEHANFQVPMIGSHFIDKKLKLGNGDIKIINNWNQTAPFFHLDIRPMFFKINFGLAALMGFRPIPDNIPDNIEQELKRELK